MGVIDANQIARGIAPCWGDGIAGPKECDEVYQCELHFRLAAALREYGEAEFKRGWEFSLLQDPPQLKQADAAGYRRGVEESAAEVRSYLFEKGLSVELLDLANRIEQRGKWEGA